MFMSVQAVGTSYSGQRVGEPAAPREPCHHSQGHTRLTINRVVPKEGIRRPRPIAESAVGFLGSIRQVDISGDAPRYSYTAAVVRVAD